MTQQFHPTETHPKFIKIMYITTIHSNSVHDSLKLETTYMTINKEWIAMVYTFNGILNINEDE